MLHIYIFKITGHKIIFLLIRIYTVCMKLVQTVSKLYHSNAFLSSSTDHAWMELGRDEMFYTEHNFQVDLENF